MRSRASIEQELAGIKREVTDELRYPVSGRDRRPWFKRMSARIEQLEAELDQLEKEEAEDAVES